MNKIREKKKRCKKKREKKKQKKYKNQKTKKRRKNNIKERERARTQKKKDIQYTANANTSLIKWAGSKLSLGVKSKIKY